MRGSLNFGKLEIWRIKVFQGSFKGVSRVFQDSFKGVSRKIEGCFKGVFSGFQGYLKQVQRYLREASKVFKEV